MNTQELAKTLLTLMGGSSNLASLTHCATRLRPQFRNPSAVQLEKIDELPEVSGLVHKGADIQIVIGLQVGKVYKAMCDLIANEQGASSAATDDSAVQTQSFGAHVLDSFVKMVVAIFSPLLPVLAGSGLIKGLTILATETGILSSESTTHALLYAMTTTVFWFFPVLVAITAAKRFKASPYIAAIVMGTFILPDFMAYIQGDGGNMVSFFGIDAPIFNYTCQVLPAIVSTWIQSKIEHALEAHIPTSLQLVAVPTILIFVMTLITLYAVGPVGNYVSIAVAQAVSWIAGLNPIITGAFIGGIWNILIMLGVHWAPNTMVIIPEIARTGSSPFIAYGANANFGMAGAALTIALRSKNKKLQGFSWSAIASVMLSGIVEPAIYGLGIKFKTPLAAGCLGAALGGAFMGAFGVTGNAFVFGGLTTIPAFAGATLWAYVCGIAISFIGGALFTLLFGVQDPEAQMSASAGEK